jgi:hypothetical protein
LSQIVFFHYWYTSDLLIQSGWEKEIWIIHFPCFFALCLNWSTRIVDRCLPSYASTTWKVIQLIWDDISRYPTSTILDIMIHTTMDNTSHFPVSHLAKSLHWRPVHQAATMTGFYWVPCLNVVVLHRIHQSRIITKITILPACQFSIINAQVYRSLKNCPIQWIKMNFLHEQLLRGLLIVITHNVAIRQYKAHGGDCSDANRNIPLILIIFNMWCGSLLCRIWWIYPGSWRKLIIGWLYFAPPLYLAGYQVAVNVSLSPELWLAFKLVILKLWLTPWIFIRMPLSWSILNIRLAWSTLAENMLHVVSVKRMHFMKTDSRLTVKNITQYGLMKGDYVSGSYDMQDELDASHLWLSFVSTPE